MSYCRCKGKVFHAERMLSKNNVFHESCLIVGARVKCSTLNECYQRIMCSTRHVSLRCKGKVFHAERMLSKNNVFHESCLIVGARVKCFTLNECYPRIMCSTIHVSFRCKGIVFHAERMLSKNNVFYNPCLI